MNLIEHLTRQVAFSRATFGPSERTAGVIDHIRKELVEIAGPAPLTDAENIAASILFEIHVGRDIPGHLMGDLRDALDEREAAVHDAPTTSAERAEEWVDVVILALDGLTRAIRESYRDGSVSDVIAPYEPDHAQIARVATGMILGKQNRNELRDWPDWRTAPADKAIEHTKGKSK